MTRLALYAAILLSGCATPPEFLGVHPDAGAVPTYERAQNSRLIAFNYAAADKLLQHASPSLDRAKPILTATLVNIDNLHQSSRLGRLISEHLSSRFTQQGMQVIEMKMRGTIFVQAGEGELLLSREVKDISASHRAQAVIVGTYASGQDYIYVTTKLVRSADNVVLAAESYVLPMDSNLSAMVAR
jgi:TolB-like protein